METGNPDPFDSGLADIDRITKRYEDQDAKKELAQKAMTLNGDPRGGIDNIYAASIRHSSPEDDHFMSDVFETWLSTRELKVQMEYQTEIGFSPNGMLN